MIMLMTIKMIYLMLFTASPPLPMMQPASGPVTMVLRVMETLVSSSSDILCPDLSEINIILKNFL